LRSAILSNSQTTATIAVELVSSGEVDEGIWLLRTALEQKMQSDAGILDLAATRTNLAVALARLGEFDNARVLLTDALAEEERVYGPRHPEVARTLLDLAFVMRECGDPEKAQEYSKRARLILEPFGVSNPDDLLARVRLRF
jgi:hypothetical protein